MLSLTYSASSLLKLFDTNKLLLSLLLLLLLFVFGGDGDNDNIVSLGEDGSSISSLTHSQGRYLISIVGK